MIRLTRVGLRDFRCHGELELTLPGPPWVVLAGGNGAGKTSILEALFAAARGRSFRTRVPGEMIRGDAQEALVTLRGRNSREHVLGVAFGRASRETRLDGAPAAGLAAVAAALPVEYVSGEAHRLVSGTPGTRRRFLDWGLFHVEPDFFPVWQAWRRAHRQRNELLRAGRAPLESWTAQVAEHGERLSALRALQVDRLERALESAPEGLSPGGRPAVAFRRGWRQGTLAEALHESAGRERQAGRAVVGPQHDDWRLTLEGRPGSYLSRGQAKLASLLLLRAQARLMAERGREPVLLVDDLLADLDAAGAERGIAALRGAGAQVWISVLPGDGALPLPDPAARFHVEPGRAEPF